MSQNEYRAELGFPPDEDNNEAVISGPMGGQIIPLFAQLGMGNISPEQFAAYLENMGLPTESASRIAGVGEEVPARQQEQQQQTQEAVAALRAALEELKRPLDLQHA